MDIIENNKLIAEFMGLVEPYELPQHGTIRPNGDFKTGFTSAQLKYHTSWEWLMPVVEKIECTTTDNDDNSDTFFNVMIEVFECNINGGDSVCICKSGNTKREATYKAVVEFIKWYNKNG
jgi:hypothetical protein